MAVDPVPPPDYFDTDPNEVEPRLIGPPKSNGGRVLPSNLQAEESLLGAMLLAESAVLAATEILSADDFYRPAHGHIFDAISRLHGQGNPIDPVTVGAELRRVDLLETVGGPGALVNLQAATPATSNAHRYATIIAEHAWYRRTIRRYTAGIDAAYDLLDPEQVLAVVGDLEGPTNGQTIEWEDIGASVAGEVADIQPELMTRTDGVALMYPGLSHWLMGKPGKGKTMIAIAAMAQEIREARVCIYLDWEGNRRIVGSRLRAMSISPEQADNFVLYLRPRVLKASIMAEIAEAIRVLDVSLVVVDGVAKSLARQGYNEDKAPDVIAWFELVIDPLTEAGAAVLCLDHVVKDEETRGLWARGSGAKQGEITGAAWSARADVPFSRSKAGSVSLIQAKDREGYVGADGDTVTVVHFTPDPSTGTLGIEFRPPPARSETGELRPTHLMDAACRVIENLNIAGIEPSQKQICDQTKGKREFKIRAIAVLIEEGYVVTNVTNRGIRHRVDNPYREVDDEKSDHYRNPQDDYTSSF